MGPNWLGQVLNIGWLIDYRFGFWMNEAVARSTKSRKSRASSWWNRWCWGRTATAGNHRRGKCRRIVRGWTSARARPPTRWSTAAAPSKRSWKRSKPRSSEIRAASKRAASSTSTPSQPIPVWFTFVVYTDPFIDCLRLHQSFRLSLNHLIWFVLLIVSIPNLKNEQTESRLESFETESIRLLIHRRLLMNWLLIGEWLVVSADLPPLSPKPALPPRNKIPSPEADTPSHPAASDPAASATSNPLDAEFPKEPESNDDGSGNPAAWSMGKSRINCVVPDFIRHTAEELYMFVFASCYFLAWLMDVLSLTVR